MNAKTLQTDVIIIGGGHAGCTMAALLGKQGIRVACIDRDDPATTLTAAYDGRTTAVSFASQKIIAETGAWESLQTRACPIEDIKIMESGSPVLLTFLVKDVHEKAFGWIVENRDLRKALYETLAALPSVDHIAPASVNAVSRKPNGIRVELDDGRSIEGELLIGADGRGSMVRDWMSIATRGWDYGQTALVCVVEHEHPHNNTAWEDFRGEGPFAILPMPDDHNGRHRSSIVWSEHGHKKDSAKHWDEDSFNAALQERFPGHYGTLRAAGPRFAYPLSLRHAHSYIAERCALIADAAHGIHPIAGQGLNLGLRDVKALSRILGQAHLNKTDLGNMGLLQTYQDERYPDNMAMAAATDTLNKLFSNNITPLRIARKIGLRMLEKMPQTRAFFMRQAMGIGFRRQQGK